uniref:Uncharacterized protein n=1 Tax=viral metagenome TaxID=1070528 RepID=A0A6C0L7T1_9ZZZZ
MITKKFLYYFGNQKSPNINIYYILFRKTINMHFLKFFTKNKIEIYFLYIKSLFFK